MVCSLSDPSEKSVSQGQRMRGVTGPGRFSVRGLFLESLDVNLFVGPLRLHTGPNP